MAPKKTEKYPDIKKSTGKYPGPGYDETGPGTPKKQASTKYSPAPMSAAAKAKAGAAGAAAKKASDARAAAKNAGKMNKSITPPTPPAKKGMKSGGKAFTPEQLATLKKMMRSVPRLDK